jgi:hypothetical protein
MIVSRSLEEAIAEPLLEAPLEPVPTSGARREQPPAVGPPDPSELPVVTIGRPRAWPLSDLGDPAAPGVAGSPAREVFFVVRLACSFRPRKDRTSISWARFAVHLQPDEAGNQPLAFDLYPRAVERERQVSRKVTLSPSLKFSEVEASIGELGYTVDYPAVDPILSAAGFEETTPSWDFSRAPGLPVHGGKLLHAVVAAPSGLERLTLAVMLTADLDHRGFRLPAWLGGDQPVAGQAIDCTVWP